MHTWYHVQPDQKILDGLYLVYKSLDLSSSERQNNKSVFAKRNVSLRITQPVKTLKLCLFLKNAVKAFHFTFVTFDSMIGW